MKNILFATRKSNGVPMLKSTLPIILFSMFPGVASIAATESATPDKKSAVLFMTQMEILPSEQMSS